MSFSFAITVGVEVQLFVAGGEGQVFPGGPLPSLLRPEGRVIHYLESLYNVASCLAGVNFKDGSFTSAPTFCRC